MFSLLVVFEIQHSAPPPRERNNNNHHCERRANTATAKWEKRNEEYHTKLNNQTNSPVLLLLVNNKMEILMSVFVEEREREPDERRGIMHAHRMRNARATQEKNEEMISVLFLFISRETNNRKAGKWQSALELRWRKQ